ncbi:MAG: hypothetical protein WCG45_06035 [bacterium]
MDTLGNFKVGLIASILGVGISIFTAESFKKISEYKRVKKTLGFLKLITIPYLKNQSENFTETIRLYQDICSIAQAQSFLALVSNFDAVSLSFDKSWLQLIYSQDFIDAIDSDDQFNKLSNAILEIQLFTKQLTAQSVNAKHLLMNDFTKFGEKETDSFLSRAKQIRNDLNDSVQKLGKYTDKLNEEIDRFFSKSGVNHEEFER